MLDTDACIKAPIEGGNDPINYSIRGGLLDAPEDLSIRFPVPLKQWFDNIVDN